MKFVPGDLINESLGNWIGFVIAINKNDSFVAKNDHYVFFFDKYKTYLDWYGQSWIERNYSKVEII